MPRSTNVITDHRAIREWIEERGGHPAVVRATHEERGSGILRVDFPGYSGEDTLEEIDWDEFFDIFDNRNLAFLCQEETRSGDESRFFKFVSRGETEQPPLT